MRKPRGLGLLVATLGIASCLLGLTSAGATSANLSHSYHSETDIAKGSLVSLDPKRSDYVEAANIDNALRFLGVVVPKGDSLLAVDASDQLTQVATSGNANVLVSTLNGPIKVGDRVAVSPISGVGMKSGSDDHAIGLAQTAFAADSTEAESRDVTLKSGQKAQVSVGFVRINIIAGSDKPAASADKVNGLQQIVKSLTGHTISTSRIIISLVVAVVAFVTVVVLVYGSIYGSIISIGRNPLAKHAIYRSLLTTFGMVLAVAVLATVLIMFLLR